MSLDGSKARIRDKKITAIFISVVVSLLLVITSVGVTIAFVSARTDSVENVFPAAGMPTPVIDEDFTDGDTVKENVKVTLSGGDGDYYVRAAVIVNFMDGDGNIVLAVPAEDTDYEITMGSDWTEDNGYWYYNGVVSAGESTSDLIESCNTLSSEYRLVVDVVAQIIQSEPVSVVSSEWGFVPAAG